MPVSDIQSQLVKSRKMQIHILKLIIIIILQIQSSHQEQQCTNPPSSVRAAFYSPNSNHYSPISNLNSSLYTHLYFLSSFPLSQQLPLLADFSASVKSRNPSLKTLLSISTADPTIFSNPILRSTFINSTIHTANDHGFDGLDLSWQYPSDMANFATLLSEMRASYTLLLTATVYFSVHLFEGKDLDYPVDAIVDNLDWINVQCFGYHKSSDVTAADANLFDKKSHLSTSYGVLSWTDAGVPACKIVMGMPVYGRSWYLKNKEKNGVGAQVVAAGQREKMSNQTGLIAYFEIERILNDTGTDVVYDEEMVFAYFHMGGLWVSFDSLRAVEEKVRFLIRNGLLGYFLDPVGFDDANFTVSKQAYEALRNYNDSRVSDDMYGNAPLPMDAAQDNAPKGSPDASTGTMVHISALSYSFFLFLLFY